MTDLLTIGMEQRSNSTSSVGAMLIAAGSRRKLDVAQELDLQQVVRTMRPDELGYPERLWEKNVIRRFIASRTGIVLPVRTLTTYLERWGFAPEKPLRMAHARQPSMVRAWMRTEYPVIAYEVREVQGELYWFSIAPLRPKERTSGRSGPRSEKQKITPTQAIGPGWLLFLVSNRGHLQWSVTVSDPGPRELIDLLERASAGRARKLFLITSPDPLFDSDAVSTFIRERAAQLAIRFLPPDTTPAGHDRRSISGPPGN